MKSLPEWIHDKLIPPEEHNDAPRDITLQAHQQQKTSFGIHLIALSLTKAGDTLADVKLILPWLLSSLGAPAMLIGWLVPLRESLALLPQLFIAGWAQRYPRRKWLWSLGSLLQGLAIALLGLVPMLGLSGQNAGYAILILLTLFSLARCVCSIVIKDVQGKTIDKQRRGRVSGFATSAAGAVGIGFAIALLSGWLSDANLQALSIVLMVAGASWILAAISYLWVPEYADEPQPALSGLRQQFAPFGALVKDRTLIQFLITRSLFISTALVAPFYVMLANRYSEGNLTALGSLLLLAGIANLTSGNIWGRLSDLSSRKVLVLAGSLCGALGLVVSGSLHWQLPYATSAWWYGVVIFVLYVGHAGVRLGRSTYLIDMADAGNRAHMVALSNTIIGVVLLVVGSGFAMVSRTSVETAILSLGITSLMAAVLAWKLPEVTR